MKSVVISIIVCLAFLAGCNVLENPGTGEFELFNEEPEGIVIEVLMVEATLVESGKEVIVATSWGDVDILRDADINEVVHYVAMNIEATLTNIFFHTGEITLTAIEFPYTCKIPSGKLHINLPIMPIETLRQVRFTYDVGYRHPTDEKYIVEPVIKIIEVIPNSPPYICDRSPLDGAVDVLCEDNMSWAFSDPDGDILIYDVYFGTSPTPTLSASEIVDTYYAPSEINGHTTYYWKVVARDGWGGETEEPVWSFTTASRPPEISIPDQCIYENETLTLNLLDYASDQDDDPLSFILLSGVGNMTDATYTYSPDYDASGTHEVEIEVSDGWGGNATNTFIITVINVNRAPLIPSYPSPENGEVDVSLDITLSWKCGDPDGDSLTYDVYFGSSSTPALVASDIVSPEYNPGILDANTTHYWKIVAKDGKEETEGPIWSFKTILPNRPPENPLLIIPENESTVSGPDIEFLWECIDLDGDSLLYDFYLAPEAEPFGLPYLVDYPENFLLIPIEELPPEFEFWRWKVVAKDGKGGVSESEVCVFTVFHEVSPIGIWGEYGFEPGQFIKPVGICVDSEGYVYVVDHADHKVQKFLSDGTFVTMWGSKFGNEGWGEYEFYNPIDIEVDTFDFAFVLDTGNNRVMVYSQQMPVEILYVQQWGGMGDGLGEFNMPMGIGQGFEPGNLWIIYVADTGNNRIQKFTLAPVFDPELSHFEIISIIEWGGTGSGPGQFSFPTDIAVFEDLVYVADGANCRIQVFNNFGEYLFEWGEPGAGPGQFMNPHGIDLSPYGVPEPLVYVADSGNNRIQIFSMEGEFIAEIGRWGTAPGEFIDPYGVAVDFEGNIYVADSANQRIQKFAPIW
ncbi:6-bladed beta-propeller [Kosmotoga pacifica]|uniref:6-bladed beta-propeller n=1 Tax=Kosmotoga pacifica TaxID=1330330 RepID=UPI00069AD1A3|nr:6-bladed beta-propeller [Kosmotoga pacifica]